MISYNCAGASFPLHPSTSHPYLPAVGIAAEFHSRERISDSTGTLPQHLGHQLRAEAATQNRSRQRLVRSWKSNIMPNSAYGEVLLLRHERQKTQRSAYIQRGMLAATSATTPHLGRRVRRTRATSARPLHDSRAQSH